MYLAWMCACPPIGVLVWVVHRLLVRHQLRTLDGERAFTRVMPSVRRACLGARDPKGLCAVVRNRVSVKTTA
jgi:hypothetical protein